MDPPPPIPLQPTEAEQRAILAEAIEAQRSADAKLADAAAAYDRALALVEQRRHDLDSFAELDDAMLTSTIAALRDCGRTEPSSAQRDRLTQRETVRGEVAVAEQAAAMLAAERDVASAALESARAKVHTLVVHVLMFEAERILEQRERLLGEAARLMESLFAYDQLSANSHVQLSPALLSALMANGAGTLAKLRDTSSWQTARKRLLDDPMALVEIEHPQPRAHEVDNTIAPISGIREELRQRYGLTGAAGNA